MQKFDTPRDAAKWFIEERRGCSLELLRRTVGGYSSKSAWVSISGFVADEKGNRKHYGPDWIIVNRINGEEVDERFSLREIYDEVHSGQMELSL